MIEYVQNMYISIPAIHFICNTCYCNTGPIFLCGGVRYIVSGSKFSRVDNEIIVKRYACEYI